MTGAFLLVFSLVDRSGLQPTPPAAEATQTTVTLLYGNNGDGSIGPITGYGSFIGVPGSPDDPNSCNFTWFVGWHIHNSGNADHKVRLKFTVTYETGVTLNKLKGISLNVATAVDAEYPIPSGYSDTH